jgi:sulfite oxidase
VPRPAALAGQDLTPISAFYGRNHGPAPDLDPAAWRLQVGGLVDGEMVLSLADLQQRFRRGCEVATLVCAGNRRAELLGVRPIPASVPWGPATICTAAWTGARLADVPAAAGLRPVIASRSSPVPASGRARRRLSATVPLSSGLSCCTRVTPATVSW